MPAVPEELDVFRRAHGHMKQLIKDMDKELLCTNFGDSASLQVLLDHLNSRFSEFKSHEEIENQYIVRELLPRLPSDAKTTLENDIHSDNRLSELVGLVSDGLHGQFSCKADRLDYGNRLKSAIASFTVDFIPHMNEEEEVFLPLLVEHFSESELKQLTKTVNELHHLGPQQDKNRASSSKISTQPRPFDSIGYARSAPSLLQLPPEILLSILSYLSPSELLSLSRLHSKLNALAFDGSLWQHLHPVRWAQGHKEFYQPLVMSEEGGGGEEGGGEAFQDAIIENDVTKELLSVGEKVNANLAKFRDVDAEEERAMEREMSVLCGVIEHLLPRVGTHVRTLELAYGKAVTNEVAFRMLRQCPNLRHLDLSHTKVSDFAFKGLLSSGHQLWQLEYLDLSGCSLITDSALRRITQALSSSSHQLHPPHAPTLPHCKRYCYREASGAGVGCGGVVEIGYGRQVCGDLGGGGVVVGGANGWKKKMPRLKALILSGCHHLTDDGLRSLSGRVNGTSIGFGLPHLCYLDLSGVPNITQNGLSSLLSVCPQLQPEMLFYCDNISYGPYSDCANGCQNVGSTSLVCCRQMM